MNYIVLDFEFNSVPFGCEKIQGNVLQSEIIQIGAVKLNNDFLIVSQFNMFVRPQYYKRINQKISKITQIRQYQIDQAPEFKTAFDKFWRWIGKDEFILCVWGPDDILQLNKHCKHYNLEFICKEFIDIQLSFWNYNNLDRIPSLKKAVEYDKIAEVLRFHSAINDAMYTALIFRKLLASSGFDLTILNIDELKPPKKIIAQPIVNGLAYNKCPKCGRFASVSKRWLAGHKGRQYIKYGNCTRCGICFRITLNKNGSIKRKTVSPYNK